MKNFTRVSMLAVLVGLLAALPMAAGAGPEEERTIAYSQKARYAFNQGMETGDLSAYYDMWAEDALNISPRGEKKGRATIAAYYDKMMETWKVQVIEQWNMVQGSTLVSEFIWRGIHRPTGKILDVDIVAIYRYNEDGKRQTVKYYYDTAKFAKFMEEVGSQ